MPSGIKNNYQDIFNLIASKGCELLSKEYISQSDNLELRCGCGNIFTRQFKSCKKQNIICCEKCLIEKRRNMLAFSYEYVKSEIEKRGHKLLSTEYINNNQTLLLECSCGNKNWKIKFVDFRDNKYGCLICTNKRLTDNQSFSTDYIKLKMEIYGYKLLSSYKNNHEKIIVEDIVGYKYDCDYATFFNTIIKNNGNMQIVSQLNSFSVENMKIFINNNNLGYKLINGEYFDRIDKNLTCKCDRCDKVWICNWNNVRSKTGCPFCSHRRSSESWNLAIIYPELAEEWDYSNNKKMPYDYCPKSNASVFWICSNCHNSYKQVISKRANGCGCGICHVSGGAKRIYYYLKVNHYTFDFNKAIFKDLIGDCDSYLFYDFIIYKDYLKKDVLKIIEFDGLQHEKYIPFFHKTLENFEKRKRYDFIKDEYAINNGYSLLRIKQKDFDNITFILDKELNLKRKED